MSETDDQIAARLARDAGRLLVELRAEMESAGVAPTVRKDRGDRAAHEFLMAELALGRPDDAVLSEEGKDDGARLESERVWIVDPLDGTREFGESGRTDWAVHVALSVAGEPVAGAVSLPARDMVLSTEAAPTLGKAGTRPRVIVSRSRPPQIAVTMAEQMNGELVEMGSAGAKAMAVVLGEADVYPHAGGQFEWDNSAPVAVAASAGLHVSRLDGTPLRYNNADPYLPDLLICRRELLEAALAVVAEHGVS